MCLGLWLSLAVTGLTVPFDTAVYTGGHIGFTADDGTEGVAYWRADNDTIFVGLAASGARWVGFGLNDKGPGMHLADIAVCREHTQGVVTAGDYHAFQRDRPQMDFVQDWRTVASGREVQTFPAGTCPVGWTLGRGRCWKIGAANNWADADAACKAEGATLAMIASDADRAFAASLQVAAGLQHMWVNGQEDVSAGATYPTYRTDDGTLVNFSGWYGTRATTPTPPAAGGTGSASTATATPTLRSGWTRTAGSAPRRGSAPGRPVASSPPPPGARSRGRGGPASATRTYRSTS